MNANLNDSSRRRWEQECVVRALGGDPEAFGEIYDAYAESIYRRVLYPLLGNAAAAEDALAESFRVAFQGLEAYKPGDVSIYYFLAAIARNKALDMHRARKVTGRALANFQALLEPLANSPASPEQLLEQETSRQRLGSAVHTTLAQINARYRQAIALRFIEDQPRDICAARLGVKVATFDVLLLRALRAFRKRWEELRTESPLGVDAEAP